MNKHYKIKVGIEEFPIEESDIPRIIQAMKTGDMVQVQFGLFRGNSILAICRDQKREDMELALQKSTPSPEQIENQKRSAQLRKQMSECTLCNHDGWIHGERSVKPCACRRLPEIIQ